MIFASATVSNGICDLGPCGEGDGSSLSEQADIAIRIKAIRYNRLEVFIIVAFRIMDVVAERKSKSM